MPVSKRRITKDGIRVLVCGFPVSKEHNLICMLPPASALSHSTHTTLAISREEQTNEDGEVVQANVLVLGMRQAGGEVEWEGVGE